MCSIDKNEQDSCALERSSFPRLVPVGLVRSICFSDDELGNKKNRTLLAGLFKKDESVRYYWSTAWQECHVLSGKFDDKSSITLSVDSIIISLLACFTYQEGFEKFAGSGPRGSIIFSAFNGFLAVSFPAILTVENEPR